MSKRTIILIILLIIVSVGLIYTAAFQGKQQMQQTSGPMVTPIIVAHTILSLSPAVAPNSIDIAINTMGDNVTAVQAEMVYDPTMVRTVRITQGAFLTNPVVLFNQVDQKTGRVSYAIGIQPTGQPQKGLGTVATISYTLMPGVKGPVTFTFLPKTKVTAEGISQSVLKTANSLTITLPTGSL
jgi:hypothetical protein